LIADEGGDGVAVLFAEARVGDGVAKRTVLEAGGVPRRPRQRPGDGGRQRERFGSCEHWKSLYSFLRVRMRRRFAFAAVLILTLPFPSRGAGAAAREPLPLRLSDRDFWKLSAESSEADGYFRSDNLTSNELLFERVLPDLVMRSKPGGV